MKKINYQSPEVEVINIGAEGVLCQSTIGTDGYQSLETWETEDFVW